MAEDAALGLVEEVPGRHEIERRIRRAEAAAVQNADETAVFDEDVGRDEVAVAHRVLVDLGQRPKLRPHPPQEGYVEQVLALPEACLEPLVVVREVPAAADAVEARPRVSSARIPAMSSARSWANAFDPAGSSTVASWPDSQVWTLHGSG
jgi:hypothetical protein